jgi:hypothetical protein
VLDSVLYLSCRTGATSASTGVLRVPSDASQNPEEAFCSAPHRATNHKKFGCAGKPATQQKSDDIMVDLLERLDAMFRQESTSYKTIDYLNADYQAQLAAISDPLLLDSGNGLMTTTTEGSTASSSSATAASSQASNSSSSGAINDIWREKICEWCYQVIDHFNFSREVVAISVHYLDRYLAGRPCGKKIFQLAAMTSLFLAIKLYEPGGKLSMQSMIELSRGYFDLEQMAAMEVAILRYVFRFRPSPFVDR